MSGDQSGTGPHEARGPEDSPGLPGLVALGTDQLIRVAHVASPDELPGLVAEAAALFGGQDTTLYLADLQQRLLVPFQGVEHDLSGHAHHVLGVEATVAGRAFQQMQRMTQTVTRAAAQAADAAAEATARAVTPAVADETDGDRVRVWQPLVDGTERLGVLGLTLPTAALDDAEGMQRIERFASVVAELVVTKTVYGDSIVRLRRTSQMTLAAEVQWALLPPLAFANRSVTIAGGLEPAYEVAGDSLDYAVDGDLARFAVFDGMGHGIVSAQLINLVVAAYRNARRCGQSLSQTAAHIEAAVDEIFRAESFATGVLCELDTTRGVLTWISAGHHEPLLLREGRLVRALEVEPLLPMGLNQQLSRTAPAAVGTEQLQPGDMILLYTDGVIEARSPDGEFFGQDRLVDLVSRNLAAGLPAPETMRRAVHALLDHQAGDLDDDATLLLVQWHGPAALGAASAPDTAAGVQLRHHPLG